MTWSCFSRIETNQRHLLHFSDLTEDLMCLWIGLFPYNLAFNDLRTAMLYHAPVHVSELLELYSCRSSARLTHQGLLIVHGPTQQETELSELRDPNRGGFLHRTGGLQLLS